MKTKLYFFLWVCLSTLLIACVDDGAEVATCTVTCGDGAVEPEIPVTDVVLNKSTLSLIEGQSESLQVIITPDDATNKKSRLGFE